jgi:fatty-acyl-CoA synthase
MGRKPLASIVLANTEDTICEELIEFLSRDFVKYQILKTYVYITKCLKSVGKFDKKEIRRLFAEGKLM